MPVSYPFLDAEGPIAFAHRGYAPDGAENSLAAFQRAIDLGYRYLETDVRVTADGVALAFHDATLDRLTGRHGRVDALPWSEIRRLRIAGLEPIPLLADVLGTWPEVRINLDVKSGRCVAPTVTAIRATGSLDRICAGAFSDRRIAALRRALGPGLCTSLGPREALGLRVAAARPTDRRLGGRLAGRCAQVPARVGVLPFVDRGYLKAAHRIGVQVHVWTVNEQAEMIRLLDLGVDGLITDRADVLRDVLVERQLWPRPR